MFVISYLNNSVELPMTWSLYFSGISEVSGLEDAPGGDIRIVDRSTLEFKLGKINTHL